MTKSCTSQYVSDERMNYYKPSLPHLLQTLEVFTEGSCQLGASCLHVLASCVITLSIQKPGRNFELERILDD